jgi:microcompartment protein CcmK/EutM
MTVGKVVGNVVSTNKSENMLGMKMLIVQPLDIETQKVKSDCAVAIDTVGAGEGEVVLCVSGSSARQTHFTQNKPVDMVIVGIIDSVEVNKKMVFKKY